MSCNKWWSTKVSEKLLFDLVIFSNTFFCYFIRSPRLNPSSPTKIYNAINTKWFWNIPKEKYFAPLRILNLFIKSFVNPLFDVSFFSLLSKSVFLTKLGFSFLLAKFACFSLALKFSDVNLLHCWVVMCLLWSWSVAILFSISQFYVL